LISGVVPSPAVCRGARAAIRRLYHATTEEATFADPAR
jgi:hypothetical protein